MGGSGTLSSAVNWPREQTMEKKDGVHPEGVGSLGGHGASSLTEEQPKWGDMHRQDS